MGCFFYGDRHFYFTITRDRVLVYLDGLTPSEQIAALRYPVELFSLDYEDDGEPVLELFQFLKLLEDANE